MTDVYYRTTQGAMVKVEDATFENDRDGEIRIVSEDSSDEYASINRDKLDWVTTMPQVAAGFGWVERVDGKPNVKEPSLDAIDKWLRSWIMNPLPFAIDKRDPLAMLLSSQRRGNEQPTPGCSCPACTALRAKIEASKK